jgi:hypothetical protein
MKDIHCVDAERIGDVLEHPEDHPLRRHGATCPRCRTLAESYLEFLSAEPAAAAGLEEARPGLDAAIARMPRPAAAAQPPAPLRVKRGGWFRFIPMPALAAAAVVLVAAFFVLRGDRGVEPPVLRTGDGAQSGWRLNDPVPLADGGILLSWTVVEAADAYQVRIYGPALEILATLGPTVETTIALDRSALPADLPPGSELTWRVLALRKGAELAASAPRSVTIR